MFARIKDWFWIMRVVANWHKIPWISRLMCKLGRHDYEAYLLEKECAWLSCFYCHHRKKSYAPNISTKLH